MEISTAPRSPVASVPAHHKRVLSPTGAVVQGRRGSALATDTTYPSEADMNAQAYLNTPWVQPDKNKAVEHAKAMLFDRGMAPLWSTGSTQLDMLSAGIGLHFRLLRALFVYFSLASIIVIPCLVLNYAGTRLEEDELDPLGVARISIANAAEPTKNYTTSLIRGAGSTSSIVQYTAREIANIISACDFLYSVGFLLLIAYFLYVVRTRGARFSDAVPSVRSYGIMITGLPRDVTEQEIYKHFNELYALDKPDWTYLSRWNRCCWYGRKLRQRQQYTAEALQSARRGQSSRRAAAPDHGAHAGVTVEQLTRQEKTAMALVAADAAAPFWARSPGDARRLAAAATGQKVSSAGGIRALEAADVYPVSDTSYCGDASFAGSWVSEVSLARANGTLIKRYQALTGLFLRIQQARAVVRKYHSKGQAAKQAAAEARLHKIEAQLDVINAKYSRQYNSDVVAAYVTFNNEESANRCTKDYAGSDSWYDLAYWLQPDVLQLNGVHPLRVRRAPDPSQIVWQNLEVPWWDRLLRRFSMVFLIAGILIVSLIFIMVAQAYQSAFRERVPNLSVCGSVVPAIAFNRSMVFPGTLAPNVSLPSGVSFKRAEHPTCAVSGASRLYWTSTDGSVPITSVNSTDSCLNECFATANTGACTWPTPPRNITLQRDTLLACYCYLRLRDEIVSKGVVTGARAVMASDGRYCGKVAIDYVTFSAFIVVSSFVVVMINTLFANVLPYLGTLEGHPSVDAIQRSGALFLFLGMFLNTALLVLIINAALPTGLSALRVGSTRVFNGQYASFDVRWHTAVGAGIVLTMLMNTVSPHAYPLLEYFILTPLRKRCCMGGAATQAELNQRVEPAEFGFPTRTAILLNTVFVCLMYSTGHPVLLPIAAISLFVCYLIDKFTLLRVYRRPPRYDASMAQFTLDLLPFALLVHLGVAIWMVSDPLVLYSPDTRDPNDATSTVLATAQDAEDVIGRWLLTGAENRFGTNVAKRLRRESTVPLLFLFLVVAVGYMFAQTAQTIVMRPARALFQALCARCPRLGGERRLHLSPYSGPFAMPLNAKYGAVLSPFEESSGWRLGRDACGQLVRYRVWTDTGTAFGVPHSRDQRMLTWQVIALSGIATYDVAGNPLYAPAVRAIEAAREKHEAELAIEHGTEYVPHLPRVKSVVTASVQGMPDPLGSREGDAGAGFRAGGTGPRRVGTAAHNVRDGLTVEATASNPLHVGSPGARGGATTDLDDGAFSNVRVIDLEAMDAETGVTAAEENEEHTAPPPSAPATEAGHDSVTAIEVVDAATAAVNERQQAIAALPLYHANTRRMLGFAGPSANAGDLDMADADAIAAQVDHYMLSDAKPRKLVWKPSMTGPPGMHAPGPAPARTHARATKPSHKPPVLNDAATVRERLTAIQPPPTTSSPAPQVSQDAEAPAVPVHRAPTLPGAAPEHAAELALSRDEAANNGPVDAKAAMDPEAPAPSLPTRAALTDDVNDAPTTEVHTPHDVSSTAAAQQHDEAVENPDEVRRGSVPASGAALDTSDVPLPYDDVDEEAALPAAALSSSTLPAEAPASQVQDTKSSAPE